MPNYQAPPPPPGLPKYVIVEGDGLAAERVEAESGETPKLITEGGHPASVETPAGDTQLE